MTSTAAVLTGRTSQNTAQASMNGSCQGTAKTPAESHAKLPTFGKVETLKHLLPFAKYRFTLLINRTILLENGLK